MVNYQLYRTNVLLGGQMKYDLILNASQRGNETTIVDFHISPISRRVPFGGYIQEDLLNYAHNENIKKYYEKISSSFYKDFANPLLVSDYPLPNNYTGATSETTYEMGCRRMIYSRYQKQHEFLCPVWLEKIDDISKLEFEFQVNANEGQSTPLYTRTVNLKSNPKLMNYFNDYIKFLGLPAGEDWVLNIGQNGCQVNGLNVKTGLCNRAQLPNLFLDLSSRERPLLEFNNIITNKLNEKQMITKQLFNFNFCFNFDDILNAYIYDEMHMHPLYINIVVKYDGKALEMKDIFSNHEFISKPYLHLPELDFSNPDKIIVHSEPSKENLLDYLKDDKCIDLINKNKIQQNTCHWRCCSGSDSHFNFYNGFSSVFTSPTGQNIYIPSYNENVCDINYDGKNLDTNNITSIGYPYWCNTYNYIFPSGDGNEEVIRDTIYQNLESLFDDGSQSLWSTFTPGCIQKGIQYLGGDGCVDVLSLYTFPISIYEVADKLLAEANKLPKMQTATTYISPNDNVDVENILQVLDMGLKKYLTAKREGLKGIAEPIVVSENNVLTTSIDNLTTDYANSLKDVNDVSYKSSVFDGVLNYFNYQYNPKRPNEDSYDGYDVREYFRAQKIRLKNIVDNMENLGITPDIIIDLIRSLDQTYSTLSGLYDFLTSANNRGILNSINEDINRLPNLFIAPFGTVQAYILKNFTVTTNSIVDLKFFKNQFYNNTSIDLLLMTFIYKAMEDLRKVYQMTSSKSYFEIWDFKIGHNSVDELFDVLKPQLIRLNEFIRYLYDGREDTIFSTDFAGLGVDQNFMKFYSSLQNIKSVKEDDHLLDSIPCMQGYAGSYQDYITTKQNYIFGSSYVGFLENKNVLTFGSVDAAVEELNTQLQSENGEYVTLPAARTYSLEFNDVLEQLNQLKNFSLNSRPKATKSTQELKQHCDNLIKTLYNDESGQYSYGQYLCKSSLNSYAKVIQSLGYQGSWVYNSLSTNHVIKCLLDSINHILSLWTNKECVSWGKPVDITTGQTTSNVENKTDMLSAYKHLIDFCRQTYLKNTTIHSGDGYTAAGKASFLYALREKVDGFETSLIGLHRKVQNKSFLYFLENLYNFIEIEYGYQNWVQWSTKPANSIDVITNTWYTNLMSTAVTPYFIYLAWQQYWSGIQNFYYKEKEVEEGVEKEVEEGVEKEVEEGVENEVLYVDLDDSISNCLTLFGESNSWKVMISDDTQANPTNAVRLISAANDFLSKKACDTRKGICVSSSDSSTKLMDEAIKRFQTDYSGIYQTKIKTTVASRGSDSEEGGGVVDIRIIYEKNKDVVTKVLFWNLFENSSQQSLPFSIVMLYPNIMETMKGYPGIFGSVGEKDNVNNENNENTEAVEVKATGLLSILNSTNPNFQQLLQFKNGLTYKTTNGPTLSVEEIDYYKANLSKQVTVFRELGKIKPYFIDQHSTYQNYLYNKMKVEGMNKDYKKYTLTNLPPKYPSLGYFPLRSEQVAYGKIVDDNTKNEYNLYISNKIINLEPEFDITYKTSDSTSFDISDFINEYIADKYKDVLGEVGENPTLYKDKIKQITSLYKLEHTHIDTEIIDNEYYTVYKLKIKLK